MERTERRKISPNFKDRVSDDPTALVKPKILGTEALGTRDSRTPSEKFKRGKAMPESLLILIFKFEFRAVARQKFTIECLCRDLWCRATLYGHVFGYVP